MVIAELSGGLASVVRLESAAIMSAFHSALLLIRRAVPSALPVLALALSVAACSPAPSENAATDREPREAVDVMASRAPTQLGLCASCHGRDGIAVAANTPNLAGRPRGDLLNAMQEYLDGRRDHAPMRAMLGPIRPVDREALADWFASQPAAAAPPT